MIKVLVSDGTIEVEDGVVSMGGTEVVGVGVGVGSGTFSVGGVVVVVSTGGGCTLVVVSAGGGAVVVSEGGRTTGVLVEVKVISWVSVTAVVVITTPVPLLLPFDCRFANCTRLVAFAASSLCKDSNAALSSSKMPCLYLPLKCSWRISWRVASSIVSSSWRNC